MRPNHSEPPAGRSPEDLYLNWAASVAILKPKQSRVRFSDDALPHLYISQQRWFPDSRSITVAGEVAGVGNIYRFTLDGAEPQKITNFKTDLIYRYAWSPDGKTLAVERGVPINDVVMISDLK